MVLLNCIVILDTGYSFSTKRRIMICVSLILASTEYH